MTAPRTIPEFGWFSPRRAWRRFWSRAPRQLKVTREGKIVIGLAFAVGGAAINTGNNLLMLGWGLVLSAIVISGLLSEGALRPLRVAARPPREARARQTAGLPVRVENAASYLPSFGIETEVSLVGPKGDAAAHTHYLLRVAAGDSNEVLARFVPAQRGRYSMLRATVSTAYPFGFFEKSRWFETAGAFWVYPYRVDTRALSTHLAARLGEESAHRVGMGDDFFSLRPYRHGDDLRRVHWRRSARTGRWFVREDEAKRGLEVLLELSLPRSLTEVRREHAVAVLGSLAEDLITAGLRVGIRAPGAALLPEAGNRQRVRILTALARLDTSAAVPELHTVQPMARVALDPGSGAVLDGAAVVLPIPEPEE